jgi:hypothetical protein
VELLNLAPARLQLGTGLGELDSEIADVGLQARELSIRGGRGGLTRRHTRSMFRRYALRLVALYVDTDLRAVEQLDGEEDAPLEALSRG